MSIKEKTFPQKGAGPSMSKRTHNPVKLDNLLETIVRDDCAKAKKFLDAGQSFAVAKKSHKDTLFQAGLFHWLYKGDTALHLAAAGHRAEIGSLMCCVRGGQALRASTK